MAAAGDRIGHEFLFHRASDWGLAEQLRSRLLALVNDWHVRVPPEVVHP